MSLPVSIFLLLAALCLLWTTQGLYSQNTKPRYGGTEHSDASAVFHHRHVFNYDVGKLHQSSAFQLENMQEVIGRTSTMMPRPKPFVLQTQAHQGIAFEQPQTHRGDGRRAGQNVDQPKVIPNTTDKRTVVNLAKMTSDAYLFDPREPGWLNTSLGFNFTSQFGWDDDGLRGHVFATEDNSTVVVAFKGTTIDPRERLSGRDRVNDNRLFSCCCGAQQPYHYSAACNCSTGNYQCDSSCLTKSILQNDSYYNAAMLSMGRVHEKYPKSTFWTVGHSLGGSLASLVGLTLNIPAVTFEAPPERLPAVRLGLIPGNLTMGSDRTLAYHFGNTADPIYMGACNGFSSLCSFWGFSFESQCFTGKRCDYDTVKDKGWHSSITNHRITHVIEDVLEVYDQVPECKTDDECFDCYNWDYS